MDDIDRTLLAKVAMDNPRLAGAVLTIRNELVDGSLPPPELLRAYGQHLKELGVLIMARAAMVEGHVK